MIDIKLKSVSRNMFLDRPEIMKQMDKRTRKVLNRLGGYTRRTARNSIKKSRSKKGDQRPPSPPGQPPLSRTGKLREIRYGYDRSTKSVVVGPVILGGTIAPGQAPRALEQGGRSVIRDGKGRRTVYVKPRPYMKPAFDKAIEKLDQFWADA